MAERTDPTHASEASARLEFAGTELEATREDFARDVRRGLTASPKFLACAWFYDREGSRLFEEICALPEYYLTRAETEILAANAADVVAGTPAGADLVELGSGSAAKTRLLIAELLRQHDSLRYVPVDISRSALEASARALVAEFARLRVLAISAEYRAGLRELERRSRGRKLVLWLGSNVGNFHRPDAAAFLGELRALFSADERFVLGVDLRKDRVTLERAYDDAAGVTARFNLNLLARINAQLGGGFDLDRFAHAARYDEDSGRIEMELVSRCAQLVPIRGLGLEVHFAEGERVHTEDSYKYSLREIDALARASGFAVERQWLDAAGRFALSRFAPA